MVVGLRNRRSEVRNLSGASFRKPDLAGFRRSQVLAGPGAPPRGAVGELSTRSEPFRKWWAAHNVRYHQTGRKRLRHPTVGDLELDYEVMELAADNGLLLAIFTAEPGSRSAEALDLLGSWAASPAPAPVPPAAPPT